MEERGYICLQLKTDGKNIATSENITYKIWVSKYPPPKPSLYEDSYILLYELCFSPMLILTYLDTKIIKPNTKPSIESVKKIFEDETKDNIYRPSITIRTLSEYLYLSDFEKVSKSGYVKFKNSTLWERSSLESNICKYVMVNNKMQYVRIDMNQQPSKYMYRVKVDYDFNSIFNEIKDEDISVSESNGPTKDSALLKLEPKKGQYIVHLDINGNGPGHHLLDLNVFSGALSDSKVNLVTNKKRDMTTLTRIIPYDEIDVAIINELMDIIFYNSENTIAFRKFCYNLLVSFGSCNSVKILNTFTDNEDDMSFISATRIVNELIEYLGAPKRVDVIDYKFESVYDGGESVILVNPDAKVYRGFSITDIYEWKSKHKYQFRYDNSPEMHIMSNTFLFHMLKWIGSYIP